MRKIILKIQSEEMNIYKASRLHGWLMEQLDEEYANHLHEQEARPFSQYLYKNREGWEWHVQTLTDEADLKIGERILEPKEICLQSSETAIKIMESSHREESIDDLLRSTYFKDSPRICTIRCMTPVSFKRQGAYLIFPEVRLIFQSILQRFSACDYSFTFGEGDLLEEIQDKVKIVDYHLRTKRFFLEGIGIKGFQGNIAFKVYGPQIFVNMVNFLLQFASYSGIGIKTALGMGAIELIERR